MVLDKIKVEPEIEGKEKTMVEEMDVLRRRIAQPGIGSQEPSTIDLMRAARQACLLLYNQVGAEAFDVVAGGETAGIPLAAWISELLGLPMLYVRKQPKGFGKNAQIEGTFKENARVLLVEDLATDGGSKLNFIQAIRDAGGIVEHCFVVFHYGNFPESVTKLKEQGVSLHGLCTWWDILESAKEKSYTDEELETVRHFSNDPDSWAEKHKSKTTN